VERDLERRYGVRMVSAGSRFAAEMERLKPHKDGYALPITLALVQVVNQHPDLPGLLNDAKVNGRARWGLFGGGMPMPMPGPPAAPGPNSGRPGAGSSTPPAGYGPSGNRRPQSGYYGTPDAASGKAAGYGQGSGKGGTSKGYGNTAPGPDAPGYGPSKPGAGYGTSGGYGNTAPGPNSPGYGPR
jgi:hypothetical protein